jgi:hypothetical protein
MLLQIGTSLFHTTINKHSYMTLILLREKSAHHGRRFFSQENQGHVAMFIDCCMKERSAYLEAYLQDVRIHGCADLEA